MMKLIDTINNFLETISKSSIETYRTKINVFHQFLTTKKSITDSSYRSYLEAMKIEEIGESLEFYISTNNIKSQTIALHYISVIRRYFNFIYNNNIQNLNLLVSFGLKTENPDSYRYKMMNQILNDSRLEARDEKEELSLQEVEILVAECDQKILEIIQQDRVLNYKIYPSQYNDLMSSIIIKLILLTGIPYRTVRNISLGKINIIHNTIDINNYSIHLPNNLSEQLTYFLKIRGTVHNNLDDALFVKANGKKLADGTGIIVTTLKEYINRSDLTGIVKYAVIQMILNGVNQSILINFTKVGDQIYKYCQEKVSNENTLSSRYIDAKLRSIDTFDIL